MSSSIYTIDGGKLSLNFHEGQLQVWDATERFVAMIAGTQSGKTSFGPFWLWREIMNCGGGDYIAATASYDLFKLKMLPELLTIFCELFDIGRYWAGEQIIELRDPETGKFWAKTRTDKMYGRIILRAASSPGGLESATAKAAWLDEAGQDRFGLDAYEAVLRRLSLYRGRVLITTTPYNLGWLKQQIFDRRFSDNIAVYNFPSYLNPAFPRAEFEERRETMQKWRFDMMYQGIFSRPAGLIYGVFIDELIEDGGHKCRPFEIPKAWPCYVAVDPGGANTAKIYAAENPETNVFYLYRESLTGQLTTNEHVQEVLRHKEAGERFIWTFIGQPAEEQYRRDYMYAGMPFVKRPAIKGVEEGIDRVVRLMKSRRLIVFDNLHGILDEIGTYTRKLDENGEPTDAIENKSRFHRLDALRYLAVGVVEQGVGFV